MKLTQDNAIEIVKKHRGGTLDSIFGPCIVGRVRIFQVWVWIKSDNQYDTRFVTEVEDEEPRYFADFTDLSVYLNELYAIVATDAGSRESARELAEIQLQKFSRYVAALVFVLTVGAIVYVFLTDGTREAFIVPILLGVVASGAVLFFGRWIAANAQNDVGANE